MRTLLFALTGIVALTSTQCFAIGLGKARKEGLVCEKSDGLLKNTSGRTDVDDMVTEVNYKRLQQYKSVAKGQSASLSETQNVFGQKLQSQHGGC